MPPTPAITKRCPTCGHIPGNIIPLEGSEYFSMYGTEIYPPHDTSATSTLILKTEGQTWIKMTLNETSESYQKITADEAAEWLHIYRGSTAPTRKV